MDNKKIIIGISGVVIVGVGIYLVTRKPKPTPPPNNLPTILVLMTLPLWQQIH